MSEADKMFDELGYKRADLGIYNDLNIMYEKENGDFINFIPGLEGVTVSENNALTVKELKAINKKCEELNWL